MKYSIARTVTEAVEAVGAGARTVVIRLLSGRDVVTIDGTPQLRLLLVEGDAVVLVRSVAAPLGIVVVDSATVIVDRPAHEVTVTATERAVVAGHGENVAITATGQATVSAVTDGATARLFDTGRCHSARGSIVRLHDESLLGAAPACRVEDYREPVS